jgi:hypothetical protein
MKKNELIKLERDFYNLIDNYKISDFDLHNFLLTNLLYIEDLVLKKDLVSYNTLLETRRLIFKIQDKNNLKVDKVYKNE